MLHFVVLRERTALQGQRRGEKKERKAAFITVLRLQEWSACAYRPRLDERARVYVLGHLQSNTGVMAEFDALAAAIWMLFS